MMADRNSYIISKALKSFVLASILTAAAGQLASTFDAIILGQDGRSRHRQGNMYGLNVVLIKI